MNAVIWIPNFRLQAVRRRSQSAIEPIALVDDGERQSRVMQCNRAAARYGVEDGLATVQAIARCPDLEVIRPSSAVEQEASQSFFDVGVDWVPGVEINRLGMLTLDLSTQPSEQWEISAAQTRDALWSRGFECAIGLAESPDLARIAAMGGEVSGRSVVRIDPARRLQWLDQMPWEVAEVSDDFREQMLTWGLPTLGTFARLRREEVSARLDAAALRLWLQLSAQERRPLDLERPRKRCERRHEFEYEVREKEPLYFILRRLLDTCSAEVAGLGQVVRAIRVWLMFAEGQCHAQCLELPEPTLSRETLYQLATTHVEGVAIPGGVVALQIRLDSVDPSDAQTALFGKGLRNVARFEETLEQLRKRLGPDRIGSPRATDDHRPGFYELLPLTRELHDLEEDRMTSGATGPPRAGPVLRRFPIAQRVDVQQSRGQPKRLRANGRDISIDAREGPFFHTGQWWESEKSWAREEWIVQLSARGLYSLVHSEDTWWLEGRWE